MSDRVAAHDDERTPTANNNETWGTSSAISPTRIVETNCQCPHIVSQHQCSRCSPWRYQKAKALGNLRGEKLLVLGDSIAWQLSQAMQCYANDGEDDNHHLSLKFCATHLFPLNEDEFESWMNGEIGGDGKGGRYVAIVFGIGTWYNWEWGEDVAWGGGSANISGRTTLDSMELQCTEGLSERLEAEPDVYQRALLLRSECRALLGWCSFVSGLMRLRAIAQRNPLWPPIVWKSIPPQHFNTMSGQYNHNESGLGLGCAPIKNRKLAYGRNRIADQVLNGTVVFARTWNDDVNAWDQHVDYHGDCTHYCNPSRTLWNWVERTLKSVLIATGKRDAQ